MPIAVIIEPVLSLQAKGLRLDAMMVRRGASHRLRGRPMAAGKEPGNRLGGCRASRGLNACASLYVTRKESGNL